MLMIRVIHILDTSQGFRIKILRKIDHDLSQYFVQLESCLHNFLDLSRRLLVKFLSYAYKIIFNEKLLIQRDVQWPNGRETQLLNK